MYCVNCGNVLDDSDKYCRNCGASKYDANQGSETKNPYIHYESYPLYEPSIVVHEHVIVRPPAHGIASASLALGILGLVFVWAPGLGIILSIIGLILAIVAMGKGNKQLSVGGLVTSILGGILSFLLHFSVPLMLLFTKS